MSTLAAGTNAPAPALPAALPRANRWLVAIAVALGALLEVVDASIVNVAIPEIQTAVGASLAEVSWVVSSYGIANVIVLPLTAWLGARFGKKRYFVFSLVGFTLASVLCGLATSLPMLVTARVLQGLMGGGLLAKAQAFLFETFPKEEQPLAQGFFGAIVIAGPAIGPTLGGWITTYHSFRWIFYVNVPVGIVAVLLCLHALPEDAVAKARARIDWIAIALLAVGIGSLQTVLEEGRAEDWFESPLIVTLGVLSVAGLSAFTLRSLGSDAPVVNLRVLRHRSLWAGSLLSIVVGVALFGALFTVPVFAQTVLRYTPHQTGILLFPGALVSALGMPLIGALMRRTDPRAVLVTGGLVLGGAMAMLTRISPHTGEDDLFWPMLVRAAGTVTMFLPLSLATLGPIPLRDVAAASGFYNLTRHLGGSMGVALLSTLLADRQAFHRAVLVEKLGATDPLVIERVSALTAGFVGKGMSLVDARASALAVLDRIVGQQSAVLSFADAFWAVGTLVIGCLPLVLLLGRPPRAARPPARA